MISYSRRISRQKFLEIIYDQFKIKNSLMRPTPRLAEVAVGQGVCLLLPSCTASPSCDKPCPWCNNNKSNQHSICYNYFLSVALSQILFSWTSYSVIERIIYRIKIVRSLSYFSVSKRLNDKSLLLKCLKPFAKRLLHTDRIECSWH